MIKEKKKLVSSILYKTIFNLYNDLQLHFFYQVKWTDNSSVEYAERRNIRER